MKGFSFDQPPKTYSAWVSKDTSITLIEGMTPTPWLVQEEAVLLYSFKAASWEEANQKHYDKQGWGKYIPIGD